MGGARHPKPYNEGPRRQVTIPWKRRVLAKLKENREKKIEPANIGQLRGIVGAPKGSLDALLDLEREPQQLTSTYVDEIDAVLGTTPPLVETDEDDEDFARDVQILRTLTRESRRDLMIVAQQMPKKKEVTRRA